MAENTATTTVVILFVFLLFLVLSLFVLYKKLNKEANGEYTIENIMFKEGGVRDQVRGAALAMETRLGVQLWPRGDTDEEGDEMQEVHDEEGLVEEGDREGSDSEEDDQGEEEEDNVEQSGKTKENGGDTSNENSSVEDSEGEEEEETMLINQSKPEVKKGEEQEEKVGDGQGKGEASGGTGLLIDLKQFSGSAIWSEEEGDKGKEIDVTPL